MALMIFSRLTRQDGIKPAMMLTMIMLMMLVANSLLTISRLTLPTGKLKWMGNKIGRCHKFEHCKSQSRCR